MDILAITEKPDAEVALDRSLAQEESQSKTAEQGKEVRKAVQWRRKVVKLGSILVRRGVPNADALAKITSPDKSFSNLRTEIEAKVNLLKTYAPKAPNVDYAKGLIDAGASISIDLKEKDAAQELDIAKLPKKTRDAYLYKGLLYLSLKQVNDAGQGLDEPAGPYTLGIYHRRQAGKGSQGKGKGDTTA